MQTFMTFKLPIIILCICLQCSLDAQSWQPLAYHPDKEHLELNPLKGLTPLYTVSNEFPHSIRGLILGFDQIMLGIDNFDWTTFDDFIQEQGDAGRFAYLQVNVDMGFNRSDLPGFLSNVPRIYYDGSDPDDGAGVPSMVVEYNHPEMMSAMLNFIQRFGERYNDNPRVWLVHYGLYGIFGEWDLGFGKKFVPAGEDWAMSETNQRDITNAYALAFPDKSLLARFPENVPESQEVGYSDGLYFGGSVSDDPAYFWFFHPKLQINHADLNWKNHPIGGEVDPDVQPYVWEQFPNNVIGLPQVNQNTDEAMLATRPTFLFQDYIFNDLCPVGDSIEWANAIKASRKLGYTFHIDEYRISAEASKPALEVNIQNTGLAPMYADWDVEFAYLDANGGPVSLGTSSTWNLSTIQPNVEDNYRSLISTVIMPDGIHTFVVRIINPLEAISASAKPVRFANSTQDADTPGWLTLGDAELINGTLGSVPKPVSSINVIPGNKIMGLQEQFQIVAQVFPGVATNRSVTWSSNRPRTASVDENGLVTTYNLSGEVEITAYTQDGGIESICTIIVEPFWRVPGLVEAEGFSTVNNAQSNTAPDSEGGGQVIGFIDQTTYLDYELEVDVTGDYILDFRASSPFGTFGAAKIHVLDENLNFLKEVSFSPSSPIPLDENCDDDQDEAFNIYQTYRSEPIPLVAGRQTIRIDVEESAFNLNWFEFSLDPCVNFDPQLEGSICDDGDNLTQVDRYNGCECTGIPNQLFTHIPAKIEAEEYYDGFQARKDVKAPASEGCSRELAFLSDDTWMEYPVFVEQQMDFIIDFRASSPQGDIGNAIVDVLDNSGTVLTTVSLSPSTGDSDTYSLFSSSPINMPVGYHNIRIDVVTSNFNLNWLEFRAAECNDLVGVSCDDNNPDTENDEYILNCVCEGTPIVNPFIDIPSLIEAEDFSEIFNAQVNPAPSGESGGDVIGFISDDTWMDYNLRVGEDTYFTLDLRASSPFGVGVLDLLDEDSETIVTIQLTPATASFDDYETFSSSVFLLPEGSYTLRLDVVASSFNLNWIEFKEISGCDVPIGGSCNDGNPNTEHDVYTADCECKGTPAEYKLIPGRIEAEDYFDVFDAQINPAPHGEPGGSVLGFIGDDTWMEYGVRVVEQSEFEVELRASSPFGLGEIDILDESGELLTTISMTPATADFNTYSLYKSNTFTLPKGCYRLRLDVVTSAFNLNWIKFRGLNNCVSADVGTLSNESTLLNLDGTATITAKIDIEPVVPVCSTIKYILTSGTSMIVNQIGDNPSFTVNGEAEFRIHSLLYDETLFSITHIQIGITTISDIEQMIITKEQCPSANVDNVGTLFSIQDLCVHELQLSGLDSDKHFQVITSINSDQQLSGQFVEYTAGVLISLNPGFEVQSGTIFKGKIEDCSQE